MKAFAVPFYYCWIDFNYFDQGSAVVVDPIPVDNLGVIIQLCTSYLDDTGVVFESCPLQSIQDKFDTVVDVGGMWNQFGCIVFQGPVVTLWAYAKMVLWPRKIKFHSNGTGISVATKKTFWSLQKGFLESSAE